MMPAGNNVSYVMAGKVQNFKVCNPLKHYHGLTGKSHAICHNSYNLPLATIFKCIHVL